MEFTKKEICKMINILRTTRNNGLNDKAENDYIIHKLNIILRQTVKICYNS
jgi:hypothetical protein